MNAFTSSTRSTLLAGLSLALLTAAASSAVAMPIGGASVAGSSSALLQRAAEQHRVYPGSESADAQKARDQKMAPNLYCEKHENLCE